MSSALAPTLLVLRTACSLACALLTCFGALGVGSLHAEEAQREKEPIPRIVAFPVETDSRLQAEARALIDLEIQRTFSSLGDVARGRELLVRRFGVLSAPSLVSVLQRSANETETWNAALTVGALRDVEGGAFDLKSALAPLWRLADDRGNSPHTRAFCCLALGCFPWPEGKLPKRYEELAAYYEAVPGPARAMKIGVRDLGETRRVLLKRAQDKHAFSSVSALLAMAKMGGAELRTGLFDAPLPEYANSEPKRALLLARSFLQAEDAKPYFGLDGLKNDETRIRAAAALALAVAMLMEDPVPWTLEVDRLLKELKTAHMQLPGEDEAVFARGVAAHLSQQADEWKELWACAVTPSSKRNCAEAACQMLLFCEEPWFREDVVSWARKPGDAMKDSVLGLVLLRAGEMATPEAFAAVNDWLRSKSLRPASNTRWDPRWYATIGLLRALHAGRFVGQSERREVVETLRSALQRKIIHREAPIRAALERALEEHGDRIVAPKDAALYHLPLAALREVERSFPCPFGLLAGDPTDACVRRVNDMIWRIYGLDALKPNKPGEVSQQPERYLKRYLTPYPYFSRLEFLVRRGYRDLPAYDTSASDLVFDR
jgi:hypothetical protein